MGFFDEPRKYDFKLCKQCGGEYPNDEMSKDGETCEDCYTEQESNYTDKKPASFFEGDGFAAEREAELNHHRNNPHKQGEIALQHDLDDREELNRLKKINVDDADDKDIYEIMDPKNLRIAHRDAAISKALEKLLKKNDKHDLDDNEREELNRLKKINVDDADDIYEGERGTSFFDDEGDDDARDEDEDEDPDHDKRPGSFFEADEFGQPDEEKDAFHDEDGNDMVKKHFGNDRGEPKPLKTEAFFSFDKFMDAILLKEHTSIKHDIDETQSRRYAKRYRETPQNKTIYKKIK